MLSVKVYIIGVVAVFGVWLSIHLTWWFLLLFAGALTWASSEAIKERKAARMQTFLDAIEMQKLEAEAKVAQARADLEREQVETARARRGLIPAGVIGAQLYRPADANLYRIWGNGNSARVTVAEETTTVLPPAPGLPGPTDLSYILGTFRPSPTRILLALTEEGLLTCSLEGISHVALAAPTGGGKSSILRLLLAQLLACEAVVWLADPHYTPLDPKTGEDWRPIAARLAAPPFIEPMVIKRAIEQLVAEMRRRYAQRSAGEQWIPCYLAVDEWPSILGRLDKRSGEELVDAAGEVLREGRKVDVNIITSSQDYLVETIGTSSEIRANLRTAYFAGGGLVTARALLDQQIKLPETPLGKGLVLLRSEESLPKPALVRVPYASNEALYRLLPGMAPRKAEMQLSLSSQNLPADAPPAPADEERERILQALDEHPEWSNARIAAHLGMRNNNKQSLIKSIREESNA